MCVELGVLDGGPGVDDVWVRLAGRSARGTAVVPQGLHEVVVHVSGEHSVLRRKNEKKQTKKRQGLQIADDRKQFANVLQGETICKRVARGMKFANEYQQ